MHKQFVTMSVKAIEGSDSGEFEAVLSAPTLDRDNEVIDTGAFNPLPKSIPICLDHNASTATTVARAFPYYAADGTLMAKGFFSKKAAAQEIRQDLMDDIIDTMSVGFMGSEKTPDAKGIDHIVKGELLEASFVPIPSNREALVLAAKALTKAGSRNSAMDQSSLNQIHDLAVAAGAECDAAAGSVEDEPDPGMAAGDDGEDWRVARSVDFDKLETLIERISES